MEDRKLTELFNRLNVAKSKNKELFDIIMENDENLQQLVSDHYSALRQTFKYDIADEMSVTMAKSEYDENLMSKYDLSIEDLTYEDLNAKSLDELLFYVIKQAIWQLQYYTNLNKCYNMEFGSKEKQR